MINLQSDKPLDNETVTKFYNIYYGDVEKILKDFLDKKNFFKRKKIKKNISAKQYKISMMNYVVKYFFKNNLIFSTSISINYRDAIFSYNIERFF